MRRLLALSTTAAVASLTLALGCTVPAQATSAPVSQDSQASAPALTDQSAALPGTSSTQAIADATLELPKGATVVSSANLSIPVTFTTTPNTPIKLKLVRVTDQSEVAGAQVSATAGADGKGTADVPAKSVEAGKYKIVDEGGLKQSGAITVTAPAAPGTEASPAPSNSAPATAAPSTTAPAQDKAAAEKKAAEAKKEAKKDERADGLDKYYPQLAKDLFDKDGNGTYKVTGPTAGGKSAGIVPKGLGSYYSQKVDFSSANCVALGYGAYAKKYEPTLKRPLECGYMIAPIDSKKPSTGDVAIGVMRIKASGKSKGSVMWNPGGPGASGMTLALVGALYQPELAKDFDMIGFDPRGTGSSMPFSQCSTDEQLDLDRATNSWGKPLDAAEKEQADITKRFAKDCFENTGKAFGLNGGARNTLMKHLGTWDAVGDLDMLRSVVGDKKLSYVGYSYGTRLGYVYAQKFQASAGRLVLDGVVDPGDAKAAAALKSLNASSNRYQDLNGKPVPAAKAGAKAADSEVNSEEQDNIAQGAGFQDTFEQFAKDCAAKGPADPAKQKTYGELWPKLFAKDGSFEGDTQLQGTKFECALGQSQDPKVLSTNSAKLLQTLETGGVNEGLPTAYERNLSFGDARTGFFQALYSEDLWGTLNVGLADLKAGADGTVMMSLADQYNDRDPQTGHYAPMLQAFTNIRCTDANNSANPAPDAHLRKLAKLYDEAAPFQAASQALGTPDYCQFWNFTGTLPQAEKLTKVPNVLVVSTSHDPATPYAAGPKLARMIDGTLLSVSGASHTSYNAEIKCVDDTVNNFLTSGVVPKDGDFGDKLKTPDTTKDDRGNTVTFPNLCKVKTFRDSDFVTSTTKAKAKDKVGFAVLHRDSEAKYTVSLTTGSGKGAAVKAVVNAQVAGMTTDNGGNHAGVFQVPAKTAPGQYMVVLKDARGAFVASRPLTVQKTAVPSKPKPPVVHKPKPKPKPVAQNSGENLSNTGSDSAGWIFGGAAAILVGAGALLVARRRKGEQN
ncbi:alpha/beta fold hydrolase [Galactobacter caseinivorans]|uniref:alpha/beta fold hydrolase n=1 Tax=Galactobacter caseinivorans TaxID=2676123 RepID=UPI001F37DC15|nr:alpha/beta fold hydrolase [Galactobacter caseinivorans]